MGDRPVCVCCGKCCDGVPYKLDSKQRDKHRHVLSYDNGEWDVSSEQWQRNIEDSRFILEHWHVRKGVTQCDQYDRQRKLCKVHENGKPPVCTKFPYYDYEEPVEVPPGCVFEKVKKEAP